MGIIWYRMDDLLLAIPTPRRDCVSGEVRERASWTMLSTKIPRRHDTTRSRGCRAIQGLQAVTVLRSQRLTCRKDELNRQADFYDIISRLFERRLFLPTDLTPEFVLDCGSGSGIEWAEEVMEKSELGPGSSSSEDDDFACQVSHDRDEVVFSH